MNGVREERVWMNVALFLSEADYSAERVVNSDVRFPDNNVSDLAWIFETATPTNVERALSHCATWTFLFFHGFQRDKALDLL